MKNQNENYRKKRKTALIGIITLGFAGLALIGIGETWKSNIFSGTSLDCGGIGFILKIISFIFLSILLAIPYFVTSIIRFIYYSILLSNK